MFFSGGSTSKETVNHLEDVYAASSASVWQVQCTGCGGEVIPDERCVTPDAYRCPACHTPVDWQTGRWIAGNPQSLWGQGFWLRSAMRAAIGRSTARTSRPCARSIESWLSHEPL